MTIETNDRAVWLVSDQPTEPPPGMTLVTDGPPLYVYDLSTSSASAVY